MSIEFNRETNTARFVYNQKPFGAQPPIVQEAILVVAAKAEKDIYQDTQRANNCGCRSCYFDLVNTKEWYGK